MWSMASSGLELRRLECMERLYSAWKGMARGYLHGFGACHTPAPRGLHYVACVRSILEGSLGATGGVFESRMPALGLEVKGLSSKNGPVETLHLNDKLVHCVVQGGWPQNWLPTLR